MMGLWKQFKEAACDYKKRHFPETIYGASMDLSERKPYVAYISNAVVQTPDNRWDIRARYNSFSRSGFSARADLTLETQDTKEEALRIMKTKYDPFIVHRALAQLRKMGVFKEDPKEIFPALGYIP